MKNKTFRLKSHILRALPFLFVFLLVLSLMLVSFGAQARADASESDAVDEDALPEYIISLSDAQITSTCGSVRITGSTVTVTEEGSYTLSGSLSDGQIRIETDKESKVRLILDGVSITNSGSAAIYGVSSDKLVIKLAAGSVNTLATTGNFVQSDGNNVDGVIFSKDDITVKGSGSLNISSPYGHGIVSKDDLTVKNGSIAITAGRKTLSANDTLTVEDGSLTLNAGTEGMEATCVLINGGTVNIQAGDDGINATRLADGINPLVEINGGDLTIVMGPGDTDGIDSNGNLIITGGTVSVNGNSTFDYDGSVTFTGGTVIVNGQQVDSIPNQMMGGFGGMGRGGQQGQPGFGAGFAPQDDTGEFGGFGQGGMGPGGKHSRYGFGDWSGSGEFSRG